MGHAVCPLNMCRWHSIELCLHYTQSKKGLFKGIYTYLLVIAVVSIVTVQECEKEDARVSIQTQIKVYPEEER